MISKAVMVRLACSRRSFATGSLAELTRLFRHPSRRIPPSASSTMGSTILGLSLPPFE